MMLRMTKHLSKIVLLAVLALVPSITHAQNTTEELLPFGDMDQWLVRVVNESFIIGGKTKYLYEIAPGDTLKNNTPYGYGQSKRCSKRQCYRFP